MEKLSRIFRLITSIAGMVLMLFSMHSHDWFGFAFGVVMYVTSLPLYVKIDRDDE